MADPSEGNGANDPLDELPGDAPAPPTQPLNPVEQGIVDETLAGLTNAGVAVGSSYSISDARTDGDGNTRVEITVPVGADGKPLPPIGARHGEDAAVAILVIEATATHKHARLVAVDSNRIYKSGSAWTNAGAFTGFIEDGGFVLPQPKRGAGAKVAAVVGLIMIAGVGLVLVLGGGDDDSTVTGTASGTIASDDGEAAGPAAGTVSTDPEDLAAATLPNGLSWVAFKSQEITPPPDPIQPLPIGHRFQGILPISAECEAGPCAYTTEMDTGPAIVVGTKPPVEWTTSSGRWQLESVADVQSSNTGGLQCVYHRTMAWDLAPTEATWNGSDWVLTAGEGTMGFEQHLDPALSAAAIAEKYCPPYAEASGWDAFVATDAATLPTTAR